MERKHILSSFYSTSSYAGSEANDLALALSRAYTG